MNLLLLMFGPIIKSFNRIEAKVDYIMAQVSISQDRLNEVASTVSEVADSLQEVIDNDNELDPADESALNAAVEKLQGVGPKVEQQPADQPPSEPGGTDEPSEGTPTE